MIPNKGRSVSPEQRTPPDRGVINIETNKFVPTDLRVCVVKVTSYDNKVLRGSLYNPNLPAEIPFTGPVELFMRMDSVFDEIHAPRSAMKLRTFTDSRPPVPEPTPDAPAEKTVATFHIRVHFRQNASWQGTIQWVEDKSEASFRSVLELMCLMDSALAPTDTPEE